jgi:exodeoxyribonuclease VII large subunit
VDLSLADLAADARASTPTAAAELVVPDGAALVDVLRKERRRLDREIHHRLDRAHQDLDRAGMALHARGERALASTRQQLHRLHHRLTGLHPRAKIMANRAALDELEKRLAASHPAPRLARARRELDAAVARNEAAMQRVLSARRSELARIGAQVAALSPLAVLDRGYAMVREGTSIIRDSAQVADGARLHVRLARGELGVVVVSKGEIEP